MYPGRFDVINSPCKRGGGRYNCSCRKGSTRTRIRFLIDKRVPCMSNLKPNGLYSQSEKKKRAVESRLEKDQSDSYYARIVGKGHERLLSTPATRILSFYNTSKTSTDRFTLHKGAIDEPLLAQKQPHFNFAFESSHNTTVCNNTIGDNTLPFFFCASGRPVPIVVPHRCRHGVRPDCCRRPAGQARLRPLLKRDPRQVPYLLPCDKSHRCLQVTSDQSPGENHWRGSQHHLRRHTMDPGTGQGRFDAGRSRSPGQGQEAQRAG